MVIPIIIPSYEPDERLTELLSTLVTEDVYVVVVDDGSGENYKEIFDRVRKSLGSKGIVLKHDVNKGKGRALKTAFQYVLDNIPDAIGAVTADSDGQHTKECIETVSESLKEHPDSLILGVRCFDEEDVPWKSRFGNTLTLKVMKIVSGLSVSDTQTGLKIYKGDLIRKVAAVQTIHGYAFDIEMLALASKCGARLVEMPVKLNYTRNTSFGRIRTKDVIRMFTDTLKIWWNLRIRKTYSL